MGANDKPYSEKRDFIRMKIGAPLNAKLSVDEDVIEGWCRDLSGGGMQVETKQAITLGTVLEVEVSSDHGHNPTLKAKAKVARSAPSDNGNDHLIGLEIISIIP